MKYIFHLIELLKTFLYQLKLKLKIDSEANNILRVRSLAVGHET